MTLSELPLRRIVSGGQTGVDRAGLDAALALDLEIAGWCPLGRRSEDGTIPPQYPLQETPARSYEVRTEWNVRDSDGTLILHREDLSGGSALTRRLARRLDKPLLCLRMMDGDLEQQRAAIRSWIADQGIHTLNVAGPRESTSPGIYQLTLELLRGL